MKQIKLGGKLLKYATVDDADFAWLNQWRWTLDTNGYVVRNSQSRNYSKVKRLYMHRIITDTPSGMVTDHINGNQIDNRRSNLRVCEQKVNSRNKNRLNKNNTTGFMGVIIDRRQSGRPYIARIMIDGKTKSCGGFRTAIEAAERYNKVALKHFGKHAFQNKVGA